MAARSRALVLLPRCLGSGDPRHRLLPRDRAPAAAAGDTAGRSRAVCNGDAGGPAALNGQIVGIISGRDCGKPGSPSLFSSVPTFNSWLESQ
ncbi:trypsin-like serine protease [Streptomyces sp. NPDC050485]|uniref:trypsin-like serine protease n=1 Tax=Streptomyces sp. NPDC050485 TaxID=3365617 RepID=UPI00379B43A8